MSDLEGQTSDPKSALMQTLLLYAVISAVLALIYAATYDGIVQRKVIIQVTFLVRVGIFIFGTVGGTVGMYIGRVIRDLVHPDFIITSDGMKGLIKARLFWAVGPQLIGMLIGFYVLVGLFIKLAK